MEATNAQNASTHGNRCRKKYSYNFHREQPPATNGYLAQRGRAYSENPNKRYYGDASVWWRVPTGPDRLSFGKFADPGLLGLCALVLIAFVLRLVNANGRGVLNLNIDVGLLVEYGWCVGNGG